MARVTPAADRDCLGWRVAGVFFVPTAQSPKVINIDYAPIHFLQANQGQERFLDFAVLYPNWGTEFGINSLSAIDLPFPQVL